jgi:hypothetical protein
MYGFGSVIGDPRSGKNNPNPGSRVKKGTGSRIRNTDKIVCSYDLGPVPVKEAAGVKFHGDRKGEER